MAANINSRLSDVTVIKENALWERRIGLLMLDLGKQGFEPPSPTTINHPNQTGRAVKKPL
jgi:hypothetical protein